MKSNLTHSKQLNLWKEEKEKVIDYLKKFKTKEDQFETVLFLPTSISRQGEGGLRTKGYYRKRDNKNPLITVITVVLNNHKYIEDTILSVLSQSYKNIEYIVIDGGSKDGTLEIIKKYNDFIDYWVSEKDMGIYDAMNKGCRLAFGQGICFLNSKDIFIGNVFNNESVFPYIIPCKIKEYKKKIYNNNFLNNDFHLYQKKVGMPTSHQAMVFQNKKMLYDLNYKISSDYDFFIRHGVFFKLNNNCEGHVLYDNEGLSSQNKILRNFETLNIIFRYYGFWSCLKFLLEGIIKILKNF